MKPRLLVAAFLLAAVAPASVCLGQSRPAPALDGEPYGQTVEYEDAPDCLRHVAADPGAVTAASLSMAIPGVRPLAIDGVAPSAESVRTGRYALGRPMYLVAGARAPAAVERLLAALASPEGQAVVARRLTPAR